MNRAKCFHLIETWMCLALPPDEIDQIERFKTLTEEQRTLIFIGAQRAGQIYRRCIAQPTITGIISQRAAAIIFGDGGDRTDLKNINADY